MVDVEPKKRNMLTEVITISPGEELAKRFPHNYLTIFVTKGHDLQIASNVYVAKISRNSKLFIPKDMPFSIKNLGKTYCKLQVTYRDMPAVYDVEDTSY